MHLLLTDNVEVCTLFSAFSIKANSSVFSLIRMCKLPSVLGHCWLGDRKGIRPVKMGGDGGNGYWLIWMEPSRMVAVSASVYLPLHHKVLKFSSGTGSLGWSR